MHAYVSFSCSDSHVDKEALAIQACMLAHCNVTHAACSVAEPQVVTRVHCNLMLEACSVALLFLFVIGPQFGGNHLG